MEVSVCTVSAARRAAAPRRHSHTLKLRHRERRSTHVSHRNTRPGRGAALRRRAAVTRGCKKKEAWQLAAPPAAPGPRRQYYIRWPACILRRGARGAAVHVGAPPTSPAAGSGRWSTTHAANRLACNATRGADKQPRHAHPSHTSTHTLRSLARSAQSHCDAPEAVAQRGRARKPPAPMRAAARVACQTAIAPASATTNNQRKATPRRPRVAPRQWHTHTQER